MQIYTTAYLLVRWFQIRFFSVFNSQTSPDLRALTLHHYRHKLNEIVQCRPSQQTYAQLVMQAYDAHDDNHFIPV